MKWRAIDVWQPHPDRDLLRRYRCAESLDGGAFTVITMDLVSAKDLPERRMQQEAYYMEQLLSINSLNTECSLSDAIKSHDKAFENPD